MARPWRDIISNEGWQTAVMDSDKLLAKVGRVAQLRSAFDAAASPRGALQSIGRKIAEYHAIDKTDAHQAQRRIALLRDLSDLALKYLSKFKVDMADAAARIHGRDRGSGAHDVSNIADETVERNVLTLARRALRKATYITELEAYYGGSARVGVMIGKTDFLNRVHAPQQITPDTVGLVKGVRMEQEDFAHRGDFEVDDDGSCGAAFSEWVKSSSTVPFFWWLEGHAVCLADNKNGNASRSVAYTRADLNQGYTDDNLLRQVALAPVSRMYKLGRTPQAMTASTDDYFAERQKDPRMNGFGNGVAAFVWTVGNELFIANHRGMQFHHSTFVSGMAVKCAGMIVMEHGKVVAFSNNSGHYKPRREHVRNFINELMQKNALAPRCEILCMLGTDGKYRGRVDDFLADFGNLGQAARDQQAALDAQLQRRLNKMPAHMPRKLIGQR